MKNCEFESVVASSKELYDAAPEHAASQTSLPINFDVMFGDSLELKCMRLHDPIPVLQLR